MARYHLKFRNIHKTVIRATDEFFQSGPWVADEEARYAAFSRWLQRSSDAYGVPVPSLEIRSDDWALSRRGVDVETGQITLAKYSVINLFHGFRHHLQQMGTVVVVDEDAAEVDAIAWACSLWYLVRPVSFRKSVRSGKITYVTPRDLLSSETIARDQAARDANRFGSPGRAAAARSALDGDDDEAYIDTGNDTNIDTATAARILGVSTSRVRQLSDQLQGVQEGRVWLYPVEVVRLVAVERGRTSQGVREPSPASLPNVAPIVAEIDTSEAPTFSELAEEAEENEWGTLRDADQDLIDSGELTVEYGPTDDADRHVEPDDFVMDPNVGYQEPTDDTIEVMMEEADDDELHATTPNEFGNSESHL